MLDFTWTALTIMPSFRTYKFPTIEFSDLAGWQSIFENSKAFSVERNSNLYSEPRAPACAAAPAEGRRASVVVIIPFVVAVAVVVVIAIRYCHGVDGVYWSLVTGDGKWKNAIIISWMSLFGIYVFEMFKFGI